MRKLSSSALQTASRESRAHVIRRGHVVPPQRISILFAIIIGLTAFALLHAEPPPPEDYIASESDDVSGDGVDDTLIASPTDPANPRPGEIYIHSGAGGGMMMLLRGNSNDDWFGYSLAVVGDVGPNGGDGHKDLLVGAPRSLGEIRGQAFLFYGPFDDIGPEEVTAENADLLFESHFTEAIPNGIDVFFGSRVAPLHDVTGNGLPEMRVLSYVKEEFTDMIGGEVLMYVFAGADSVYAVAGDFLFAVVTTVEFDPWKPFPGDVDGDSAVTQNDIDIIAANMGLQDPGLTTLDGDLNGDGVVDALDLTIALDHFGMKLLDVQWSGPAPDGVPHVLALGAGAPGSGDPWGEPIIWRTYPAPGCGDIPCNCCVGCGPPNECGGGGGTSTGDPCIDIGPCAPGCSTAPCNPACGGSPCAPGCATAGCNPACGGDPCAPGCEGSGFECEEDDPCDTDPCGPECLGGGDPPGNCQTPCEQLCNPACGGNPCLPQCAGSPWECDPCAVDPCGEDCDERFCNPACPDYDPCHENCNPECNPECPQYNPEECECDGIDGIDLVFERYVDTNWTIDQCPNNGGRRIFSDSPTPYDTDITASNRRKVKLRIETHPPHAAIAVYLKVFDVDDPSSDQAPVDANGPVGNDNRDPVSSGLTLSATTDQNGVASVSFTVSTHPGDNYRVLASTDEPAVDAITQAMADGQEELEPCVFASEMLTVWRHLHVEMDSMFGASSYSFSTPFNWITGTFSQFEGYLGAIPASASSVWKLSGFSPELKETLALSDPPEQFLDVADHGTLIIGPRSDPTHSVTIDAGEFNPIVSSDETSVQFLDTALQSIVPPAGFTATATSADGVETHLGTVTAIARHATGYDYTFTSPSLEDWQPLIDGGLSVGGGSRIPITAVDAENNVLTSPELSIAFSAHDDDDDSILPDNDFPDFSLMQAKYGRAYIKPLNDGGGFPNLSRVEVPLRKFTGGSHSVFVSLQRQQSAMFEEDYFWVAYAFSAFQAELGGDFDAIDPGAILGRTLGDKWTAIYLETIRDVTASDTPPAQLEPIVLVHEIGHQFGLDHVPFSLTTQATIVLTSGEAESIGKSRLNWHFNCQNNRGRSSMSAGVIAGSDEFADVHLDLLRDRVHSPGQSQ